MKALGQLDPHGGFDHARSGKTDQRLGLGNHHIAQKRKARTHAAHGRVGQHADVRQAFLGQTGQRGIGFGHLHQAQQPFLHARASGGGEANKRHLLVNGRVHAAHKALAHHRAHAAAHEVKLKAGCHHAHAVYRAAHDHQRVGLTGVFQRLFQALGVFAAVLELEGVHGQHLLANFIAAFVVQKHIEPRPRPNAMVVAARGAHVLVLFQIGFVEYGLATRAFDPQPLRHTASVSGVGVLNFWG